MRSSTLFRHLRQLMRSILIVLTRPADIMLKSLGIIYSHKIITYSCNNYIMLPIIPTLCSLSFILDDAVVDFSWLAIGTRDRSTSNSL